MKVYKCIQWKYDEWQIKTVVPLETREDMFICFQVFITEALEIKKMMV